MTNALTVGQSRDFYSRVSVPSCTVQYSTETVSQQFNGFSQHSHCITADIDRLSYAFDAFGKSQIQCVLLLLSDCSPSERDSMGLQYQNVGVILTESHDMFSAFCFNNAASQMRMRSA